MEIITFATTTNGSTKVYPTNAAIKDFVAYYIEGVNPTEDELEAARIAIYDILEENYPDKYII